MNRVIAAARLALTNLICLYYEMEAPDMSTATMRGIVELYEALEAASENVSDYTKDIEVIREYLADAEEVLP